MTGLRDNPFTEAATRDVLCKKVFLEQACNFIKKEILAQVFSCEFCEISKNTFLQNTSGQLLLHLVCTQNFYIRTKWMIPREEAINGSNIMLQSRLKQRHIQNPVKHLKWSFFAKTAETW